MQKAVLSNGLKVVLAQSHAAPVVNLSLLVDSGYAADPAALPGLTSLALRMMEEGTRKRDAMQIARELEAAGASFATSANPDGAFLTMNTLAATLPQSIELYSDLVLNPAFADADLERVRKEQLAAIAREKANPQTMALRVLPALLYGKGHGYAHPATGTEAAVTRVTRDDLAGYHRAWFRPNNATLLVVGDTTLAAITPLLEKAFAGGSAGAVPAKALAPAPGPQQTAVYLMDRPGAQQSVIYGAQLVQAATPQDRVHLQIVNNIFGGTFSSRINMNLREDKHWSYGVRSDVMPALGQRPFVSRSPVQTDRTKESLQELVREYGDIAGARPIGAAELREAQQREALGLPGAFETAAQLSTAYSTVLQYRLPDDYYNAFTPTVMALTPDEANALARRAIAPGRMVWVVVGDMSKVENGIRSLNLGEVRRIDPDGNLL
jgi:zinc protease